MPDDGGDYILPKEYDALPEYVDSAHKLTGYHMWAKGYYFDKVYEKVFDGSTAVFYMNGAPVVGTDATLWVGKSAMSFVTDTGDLFIETTSPKVLDAYAGLVDLTEYKEGVKALAGIMSIAEAIIRANCGWCTAAKWLKPGWVIQAIKWLKDGWVIQADGFPDESVRFLVEGRRGNDLIGRVISQNLIVSKDSCVIPGDYNAWIDPEWFRFEFGTLDLKFPEEKHKVYCQDQYEL